MAVAAASGGLPEPRVAKLREYLPREVDIATHILHNGRGVSFDTGEGDLAPVVKHIFSRGSASDIDVSRRLLRTVGWSANEEYLEEFRAALQTALTADTSHLPDSVRELYVHQTLSMLPFAYPGVGFEVNIPIGGQTYKYKLDKKFELTPSWFSTPLPAYGFTSDNENAPPLLVFMGTTFPGGDGFAASVLSDFTPGLPVGQLPFWLGKSELQTWLEGKSGVHVTGASLGGALSVMAGHEFDEIEKVYAFVPPGHTLTRSTEKEMHLCCHAGDLVSQLGAFPEGENVHLYRVMEENETLVHAHVLLGSENVTVIEGDASYENKQIPRKILTAVHTLFGGLIFLIALPFQLLYRLCELLAKLWD